ncbi:MAG: copper-translocating P-type ATPase [Tenericutes bacterium]|nr:copper-translocating P-type ATPase [Mycoplasmatota bacterium]
MSKKNNENHQHHNHHQSMINDFKKRLIVSLILTIPILLLSSIIQEFLGFNLEFLGDKYVLFGLSSIIFVYGGWPFIKGLIDEIKEKNPGMMTLIALAITVAYVYSSATIFGLEGMDFFWELATLIDIMLLGHIIEMKSIMSASNALDELVKLMPDEAHLLKDGDVKDINVSEVKVDDIILIKPGEKIPVDGIIIKGEGQVNESMVTGESKPVKKQTDSKVVGGSINGDSSLEVRVSNIGSDTYLSKIINLVDEAQKSKSKTQNIVEKTARILTFVAITVGVITFLTWSFITNDYSFALARMATVMVITCPHALGLASPLVVARSTSISAQNGLLIKNRTPFENSRKIDVIVFDKTGTLTYGNFGVNFIKVTHDDYDEKKAIQYAASIEKGSEHPIAKAIIDKAESEKIKTIDVSNFSAIKGKGVKAKIENKEFQIVSPKYLKELGIDLPDDLPDHDISTNVVLITNKEVIAVFGLSDKIREESKEAIEVLRQMNIESWMLTGDNEKTAKQVSEELGLDGYFSEVLPDEKQDKIKELQKSGKFVAMTGDGINDAPALAQADVGIAIGSGTDVAAETADIVLVKSNPLDVVSLIKLGKASYNKMVQNLGWATGYNVIAIPLAAGVLSSYGILLSPAIGAVLMSLSTVIVAINAKLLKLKD